MASPKGLRILIVDDEVDLLEALTVRLEAGGRLKVATAADGRAGLALALAERPDAMLIDVQMPEMDGWQLCSALRADARTKSIPVLIMTGLVSSGLRRRAAEVAAAGLILKPVDEGDIVRRLEALAVHGGGEGGAAR